MVNFLGSDGESVCVEWTTTLAKRFGASGPMAIVEVDSEETMPVPFPAAVVSRMLQYVGNPSKLRTSGLSVEEANQLLRCINWFGVTHLVSAGAVCVARAVRASLERDAPRPWRRDIEPRPASSRTRRRSRSPIP